MREFLKGLELDKETINTIMAEHGKLITETKESSEELKKQVKDYESKIGELEKSSEDSSKLKEEFEAMKTKIEEEKKQKKLADEEKIIEKNIEASFGDKDFVNEYTKRSIINEMKESLKNSENLGKSAKDIFGEITKDKEGIFKNPNKPADMPNVNNNINTKITKEEFSKMGYKERLALKQETPEVYETLITEK